MARLSVYKRHNDFQVPMIEADATPTESAVHRTSTLPAMGQLVCTPRRAARRASTLPGQVQRTATMPVPGQRPSVSPLPGHPLRASPLPGQRPCASPRPGQRQGAMPQLGQRAASRLQPIVGPADQARRHSHMGGCRSPSSSPSPGQSCSRLTSKTKNHNSTPTHGVQTADTSATTLQQRRCLEEQRIHIDEAEACEVPTKSYSKRHASFAQVIASEIEEDDEDDLESGEDAEGLSQRDVDNMFSDMFSKDEWQDQASQPQLEPEEWQERAEKQKKGKRAGKRVSEKKTFMQMVLDGDVDTSHLEEEEMFKAASSPCSQFTNTSPASSSTKAGTSSEQELDGSAVFGASKSKADAGVGQLASTMSRIKAKMSAVQGVNLLTGDLRRDQQMMNQDMINEESKKLRDCLSPPTRRGAVVLDSPASSL
mmetsp:Transcript_11371/g.28672  ORF Transcript_11371/g.28672 Transcript_11371/m.28672 type:complete len:425 (-) Transcript_11371:190-1464(-)|eukprot:CAMPEP_0115220450 /NCGR_PEP_ID=MMETSP0270-20121206/27452_1 /TAXON_ID=71861 /ORGANISM="Scrippsiella trochoidea, Strain CCMP3099" /LENGTH=424 /DNA_ID=CAMNT_0002634503 /DNA_START=94 /DNA_END=1368 /DNA_ORIENTATION=-